MQQTLHQNPNLEIFAWEVIAHLKNTTKHTDNSGSYVTSKHSNPGDILSFYLAKN